MNHFNHNPQSAVPPQVQLELNLSFPDDFPMSQITDIIGLEPTETKRTSETRINPFTRERNWGYWLLATEAIHTFDTMEVQSALAAKVLPSLDKIKDAIVTFHGEAGICLAITLDGTPFPKTVLSKQLLTIAKQLNAELDICVYDFMEKEDSDIDALPVEAYYELYKPELQGEMKVSGGGTEFIVRTNTIKTYDSDDIEQQLTDFAGIHQEKIKNKLAESDSKISFRITAFVHDGNYPSLGIGHNFLDFLETIQGEIEFCIQKC